MRGRCVALVVLGTYLSLTCGCISSEYVIPKGELARVAGLPPSQRGMRVHVVQELGARDEDPVEAGDAIPPDVYADEYVSYDRPGAIVDTTAYVDVGWPFGPGYGNGFVGRPGAAAPTAHPWHRAPPQTRSAKGSGSGGGNVNLGNLGGGGGGGGGNGDGLIIVAVVIVAVAVIAAAGLAVTEGVRYDGHVQLHPEQPVHLKNRQGETTVPLSALTPVDVDSSREAVVRDDEAYGFRFMERRPLDREGFAFKVDFGALSSLCACYSAAGLASNVQLGYFPHHRFGLLGTLTLGGGRGNLDNIFQRHSANLEAQFFPLSWWRLYLGGFAHGGMQLARDEFGTRTGAAWGGGVLLELAVTTRLAFTGRFDYTLAHTAPETGGWADTSLFTAGLAIY